MDKNAYHWACTEIGVTFQFDQFFIARPRVVTVFMFDFPVASRIPAGPLPKVDLLIENCNRSNA
jgi:hypothetical protein